MKNINLKNSISKMKPVVSVCITTYNHASFIAECLNNVLLQKTNFPFEIILGEDESNDRTREICKSYVEKYPDKIKLFLRNRKDVIHINGNATGRFNFIENLKEAKGKYIALCDGDDYWTDPSKLQKQVDFLEENDKCFMINHAMPALGKSKDGWYDLDQLFSVGYLPHSSNYMFRSFDLNKYRNALLNMLGGEMCVLYIAATEGKVYHSSQPVSFYRYNLNGIYNSKSEEEKLLGEIQQVKVIRKYFKVDRFTYVKRRLSFITKYNRMTGKYKYQLLVYIYFIIIFRFIKRVNNKVNRMIS